MRILPVLCAVSLLSACGGGGANVPGDSSDSRPYAGISASEIVRFTGTEPFWGGQVQGTTLTYTTPENPDGVEVAVERFHGRGGVAFGGELDGEGFDMMVTEGECTNGMSDRTYPFTVTLKVKGETRNGCAWTDARPHSGPEAP